MISRRAFAFGLLAAPAVVKYGSLMPVRGIIMPVEAEAEFIGMHYTLRTQIPAIAWRRLYYDERDQTIKWKWIDPKDIYVQT